MHMLKNTLLEQVLILLQLLRKRSLLHTLTHAHNSQKNLLNLHTICICRANLTKKKKSALISYTACTCGLSLYMSNIITSC